MVRPLHHIKDYTTRILREARMKDNEYQCAVCGKIYEKGWSDADAIEESVNKFGAQILTPMEVVCDPCFKKRFPEEKK